ncbi:MAG TPA: alpha/beta hydrolase family protein [Terriglobales bacterium]|jgi:dienelactone hydrolase|nr:alpha/beta hydrolase family protein [Terriglobales bacterium]
MPTRYAQWMHDWETRLTSVDNNRVVRPLEWGVEWARDWPCRNGFAPGHVPNDCERFLLEYNRRIIAGSDEFYSYAMPTDFRLERREVQVFSTREAPDPVLEEKVRGTYADFLRFTSPVRTPYPENNLVNARWFPARGRRAVVLLPHWNSDAIAYTSLCRTLNMLGIAVLRLSMPYHEIRMPAETRRADYAVSANIGRTLDACRQAVIDVRCCLDWLEQQGYKRLGIAGTSLGSCYAFLASAHDPRIRVAAFNHASTYVADVVWHGQSTRHIREGLEPQIDIDRLRQLWSAVSPMSYFPQFARWPRRSLIVYAKYDLTFLPEFSRQVVEEFQCYGLDHKVVALPCGHYSMGETPYKHMDGWHLASFLRTAFERC